MYEYSKRTALVTAFDVCEYTHFPSAENIWAGNHILWNLCNAYPDDIIIYTKSLEEHRHCLTSVLDALKGSCNIIMWRSKAGVSAHSMAKSPGIPVIDIGDKFS